jgi:hypothetical protein
MDYNIIPKTTFTSNGTLLVPKGYAIDQIIVNETSGNAVTGGIKIGTTSGATDVVVALAVAGNSLQVILDATLLKRMFSFSADQTLFVQTVTLWNSASVDIYVKLNRFIT